MGIDLILAIILGVCALVYILLFVVLKVHNKNEHIKKTGIDEKKGVRYTAKDLPTVVVDKKTGEEEPNLTFERQDIMLRRGFKYVVGENNKIKAGKYTLLTTEDAMKEFNIRRNGYVKSYEHNSNVILSEGDEITSINIAIILR